MSNSIKDSVDKVESSLLNLANELAENIVEDFTNELEEEANKFWEFYITEFYKYETKKYIRHRQFSPGTCTGEDIYEGKDFSFDGDNIALYIKPENFDDFHYVSKDFVWDEMVSLRRRKIPKKGKKNNWVYFKYEEEYHGKYVSFKDKNYTQGINLIAGDGSEGRKKMLKSILDKYKRNDRYNIFFGGKR